jgi:tetratricopeptide (TPR) repeat protein
MKKRVRDPAKNKFPEARPGLLDRPWFWPVLVALVAFLLRAVYTYQVRYTPFFQTLGLDAKFYDQWAKALFSGGAPGGAYFMSPLYPYFLAAIYGLFGRDLFLVRMIQAGLGAGTAALTYLLGRDLFDRRVGILAGLTTACYGALIYYDCSILLTPLLVLLNLVAVYLLVRADSSSRAGFYLASGAALGLAGVGRAAALLFVPVALLWVLKPRSGEGGSRGRTVNARRRAAAFFALGVVLVIAPVTIRNYVASRDFVVVTSNGGINFYIGNGRQATGGYVKPEGLDIVSDADGAAIAEADVGSELRPSEVSGYWYRRAWLDIVSDPGSWLALLARKLHFVTSSYELPQLENYYFQKRYSPLLRLPLAGFAVVAPLGFLGLGLMLRRRKAAILPLFAATYLVSIVMFFVVARYRMPVVPVLSIGASYVVLRAIALWRDGAWRRVAALAVVAAALAFLVNANLYGVDREKGFAQPHFRLGIIYSERGMIDEAVAEYEAAIRTDPDYPKSYLNLGAVLSEAGRTDEAAVAFRGALRIDPGYVAARVNLAMLMELAGDYERALAQIDTALAVDPTDAMALKERGLILFRTGRPEEAARSLREAISQDEEGTESAEAEFYLGVIENPGDRAVPDEAARAMAAADSLADTGRAVEALELLEEAVRLAPNSGEPLRSLALLKRELGFTEEAVALIREALRREPTMEIGHFMLGVFLNELGRHDEAIREYEAEIRVNPDFPSAHLNIALTYNFHAGNPNAAAYHYRRYLTLGGEPVAICEDLLRGLESPSER